MSRQNPLLRDEQYILVDVETAGPNPGTYALLSIGACTLHAPRQTFYIELQPDRDAMVPETQEIHRLSLDELKNRGALPREAMQQFADWLRVVVPGPSRPVFTAFNAPFDWMFVNEYFYRYLGANPFGHKALDIKAYFMGKYHTAWEDSSYEKICRFLGRESRFSHNALQDALDTADLFEILIAK